MTTKHMTRRSLTGFSTIELLIAFSVALIVLPPIVLLALGGDRSALDVSLTNDGIARAATQMRDAVHDFRTTWSETPLTHVYAPYHQENSVRSVTPCIKRITATASWSGAGGREQSAVLQSLVASTHESEKRGYCDPFPPSSWSGGVVVAEGPSVGAVRATDIAVVNSGGRAFALMTTTAIDRTAPSDDIHIYDITDRSRAPLLITSLDVGAGANALALARGYAFVAVDEPVEQFKVVRIFDTTVSPTDPGYIAPSVATAITLPGVAGAFPEARAIAYYDNMIHIGTWNNNFPANSPEYLAYNVSTPESPTLMGVIDVRHSVNDIDVTEGVAYLATTDDVGELTVVESDESPSIIARVNVPNSRSDAESIRVVSDTAVLGFEQPPSGAPHIALFDTADPEEARLKSTTRLSNVTARTVRALAFVGERIFLGIESAGFRIMDAGDTTSLHAHGCGSTLTDIEALEHHRGTVVAALREPARIALLTENNTTCTP